MLTKDELLNLPILAAAPLDEQLKTYGIDPSAYGDGASALYVQLFKEKLPSLNPGLLQDLKPYVQVTPEDFNKSLTLQISKNLTGVTIGYYWAKKPILIIQLGVHPSLGYSKLDRYLPEVKVKSYLQSKLSSEKTLVNLVPTKNRSSFPLTLKSLIKNLTKQIPDLLLQPLVSAIKESQKEVEEEANQPPSPEEILKRVKGIVRDSLRNEEVALSFVSLDDNVAYFEVEPYHRRRLDSFYDDFEGDYDDFESYLGNMPYEEGWEYSYAKPLEVRITQALVRGGLPRNAFQADVDDKGFLNLYVRINSQSLTMNKKAKDMLDEYSMHYEVSTHTTAGIQEALSRHKGIEKVYFLEEFNHDDTASRESDWLLDISLPYAVKKYRPIPGLTLQAKVTFRVTHGRKWPSGDVDLAIGTYVEVKVPDPRGEEETTTLKYSYSPNRYGRVYTIKEWNKINTKVNYIAEIKDIFSELLDDTLFESLRREPKLKDLLIFVMGKVKEDEVKNMPWFKKFFNKLFKRSSQNKMAKISYKRIAHRYLQAREYEAEGAIEKTIGFLISKNLGVTDAPEEFFKKATEYYQQMCEEGGMKADVKDSATYASLQKAIQKAGKELKLWS